MRKSQRINIINKQANPDKSDGGKSLGGAFSSTWSKTKIMLLILWIYLVYPRRGVIYFPCPYLRMIGCTICKHDNRYDAVKIIPKFCLILPWCRKNSPYSQNIWGIAIHVIQLFSVYQAQSYESNVTLLAPVSTRFAHLSMSFIL